MKQTQEIIKTLLDAVSALEALHPDRKFTLDGHLVGSIGEVYAREKYGMTLLPASTPAHDAKDRDGKLYQIKLGAGKDIALNAKPDWLLVLTLGRDGSITEVYDGPGGIVWNSCGPMQKNGQRRIRKTKLVALGSAR